MTICALSGKEHASRFMWKDFSVPRADELPSEREIAQVREWARRRPKIRFLADENVPSRAIDVLERHGARVTTALDARLIGYPDQAYTAFARRKGLILLTCDRDFLNNEKFPLLRCPGIVICDFKRGDEMSIKRTFRCLRTAFAFPQAYDIWMKMDATPDGWSETMRYLDGTTSRARKRYHGGKLQVWSSS